MKYFLIYLFFETLVSVQIASELGGLTTFFEIIASAIIGVVIISNLKVAFFESFMALRRGEITPDKFKKLNLYTLVGAILLIIPGFLTDIIGVLLQFEFFGLILASKMTKKPNHYHQNKKDEGDDDVIDVEIIEHNDSRK